MYIVVENKQHIVDRCTRLNLSVHTIINTMIKVDQQCGHTLTDHAHWAVRILHNNDVVGYLVGRGRQWQTVLSAGMQYTHDSHIYTVHV